MNVDNLPPLVRQRIDTHLDAIDDVLKRDGIGREERRNIVDNVETQLLEMLGREAGAGEPTLGQVEAVLARMDRPEAYGRSTGEDAKKPLQGTKVEATLHFAPPNPGQPRTSRTAIWGAVLIGLSVLGWGVVVLLMVPMLFLTHRVAVHQEIVVPYNAEAMSQPTTQCVAATAKPASWLKLALIAVPLCVGLFPALAGTLLGWIAVIQISKSKGLLRGAGLAWFDALFYPIVALLLAIVALLLVA